MQQQIDTSQIAEGEADYLRFVLTHSDALQRDWQEIQNGQLDMASIIKPLYAALGQPDADASAAIAQYQADFLSFVRSHNSATRSRLAHLVGVAKRAGIEIPDSLYAGGFQIHSFNAEARRSGTTNLLLVHSGLEHVLIEAT